MNKKLKKLNKYVKGLTKSITTRGNFDKDWKILEEISEEIKDVKCPYCKKEAIFCENKEIYGRNYGKSYMCYLCKECDAYVGTHNNTRKPLGTMANSELREWRKKAHEVFDPLWKTGKMKRSEAYMFLNNLIGKETHIGESDIETCKKIIELI